MPGEMSLVEPLGRFTLTPERAPASAITDEVTMKMMSSTRKMSVSGVMLISANRPSPPSSSGPFIAMALSLHLRGGGRGHGGRVLLRGPAVESGARGLLAEQLHELLGDELQL